MNKDKSDTCWPIKGDISEEFCNDLEKSRFIKRRQNPNITTRSVPPIQNIRDLCRVQCPSITEHDTANVEPFPKRDSAHQKSIRMVVLPGNPAP
jgi:hypothetical protein